MVLGTIHGVAKSAFIAMDQDISNAQCALGQGKKCVFIVEEPVGVFAQIVMVMALLNARNVMGKV